MATMTIKYDDRNKTVKNLLDGLIHSGIIHPTDAKEIRIAEGKSTLRETKEIVNNITAGTKDYETIDDLLNELTEDTSVPNNQVARKKALTPIQKLLLQTPTWSDEEYNRYIELRKHFSRWRR